MSSILVQNGMINAGFGVWYTPGGWGVPTPGEAADSFVAAHPDSFSFLAAPGRNPPPEKEARLFLPLPPFARTADSLTGFTMNAGNSASAERAGIHPAVEERRNQVEYLNRLLASLRQLAVTRHITRLPGDHETRADLTAMMGGLILFLRNIGEKSHEAIAGQVEMVAVQLSAGGLKTLIEVSGVDFPERPKGVKNGYLPFDYHPESDRPLNTFKGSGLTREQDYLIDRVDQRLKDASVRWYFDFKRWVRSLYLITENLGGERFWRRKNLTECLSRLEDPQRVPLVSLETVRHVLGAPAMALGRPLPGFESEEWPRDLPNDVANDLIAIFDAGTLKGEDGILRAARDILKIWERTGPAEKPLRESLRKEISSLVYGTAGALGRGQEVDWEAVQDSLAAWRFRLEAEGVPESAPLSPVRNDAEWIAAAEIFLRAEVKRWRASDGNVREIYEEAGRYLRGIGFDALLAPGMLRLLFHLVLSLRQLTGIAEEVALFLGAPLTDRVGPSLREEAYRDMEAAARLNALAEAAASHTGNGYARLLGASGLADLVLEYSAAVDRGVEDAAQEGGKNFAAAHPELRLSGEMAETILRYFIGQVGGEPDQILLGRLIDRLQDRGALTAPEVELDTTVRPEAFAHTPWERYTTYGALFARVVYGEMPSGEGVPFERDVAELEALYRFHWKELRTRGMGNFESALEGIFGEKKPGEVRQNYLRRVFSVLLNQLETERTMADFLELALLAGDTEIVSRRRIARVAAKGGIGVRPYRPKRPAGEDEPVDPGEAGEERTPTPVPGATSRPEIPAVVVEEGDAWVEPAVVGIGEAGDDAGVLDMDLDFSPVEGVQTEKGDGTVPVRGEPAEPRAEEEVQTEETPVVAPPPESVPGSTTVPDPIQVAIDFGLKPQIARQIYNLEAVQAFLAIARKVGGEEISGFAEDLWKEGYFSVEFQKETIVALAGLLKDENDPATILDFIRETRRENQAWAANRERLMREQKVPREVVRLLTREEAALLTGVPAGELKKFEVKHLQALRELLHLVPGEGFSLIAWLVRLGDAYKDDFARAAGYFIPVLHPPGDPKAGPPSDLGGWLRAGFREEIPLSAMANRLSFLHVGSNGGLIFRQANVMLELDAYSLEKTANGWRVDFVGPGMAKMSFPELSDGRPALFMFAQGAVVNFDNSDFRTSVEALLAVHPLEIPPLLYVDAPNGLSQRSVRLFFRIHPEGEIIHVVMGPEKVERYRRDPGRDNNVIREKIPDGIHGTAEFMKVIDLSPQSDDIILTGLPCEKETPTPPASPEQAEQVGVDPALADWESILRNKGVEQEGLEVLLSDLTGQSQLLADMGMESLFEAVKDVGPVLKNHIDNLKTLYDALKVGPEIFVEADFSGWREEQETIRSELDGLFNGNFAESGELEAKIAELPEILRRANRLKRKIMQVEVTGWQLLFARLNASGEILDSEMESKRFVILQLPQDIRDGRQPLKKVDTEQFYELRRIFQSRTGLINRLLEAGTARIFEFESRHDLELPPENASQRDLVNFVERYGFVFNRSSKSSPMDVYIDSRGHTVSVPRKGITARERSEVIQGVIRTLVAAGRMKP